EFNELDEDLGWHDFTLRSYDPQIGRFLQADPYDQFASGYVGMGNDPVNTIDRSGGWVSSAAAAALKQVACVGSSVAYSASFTIASLASSFFTVMNITVRSINDGNINVSSGILLNTNSDFSMEWNNGGDEEYDESFENQLKNLIELKNYWAALALIRSKYPELKNSTKKRILDEEFFENLRGHMVEPKNNALFVRWGVPFFKGYLNNKYSLGALVRSIYHEYIHVELYSNINTGAVYRGMEKYKHLDYTKKAIQEIFAHYITLTNNSLPNLTDEEFNKYIDVAIEEYNKLTKEEQEILKSIYETLKSMKK
ncbi:RHS repeat domain-containing protein, partial [Polluticaenibacter yanchengensis]|nr:hypothetical protein [Chitinophagaceae bacterium LY-5]